MNEQKGELRGTLLGILSAAIGGVCPIYWRQIKSINSVVILFYRVVLVCLFTFIICMILYKWDGTIGPLRRKGAVKRFFLTGVVMVTNWGVYVWAVNSGYIIQASIGYFIMPLVVCVIGMVFFKEPVRKYKIISLLVVLAGTVALIVAYGEIPTIAFAIAITYATYTSAQKTAHITGIQAMFYQTLFVLPFFLTAVIYAEVTGQGALASATGFQLFLLSFAGIVTALPLILLLDGINSASLVVMGLTTYLGDTITLLLGIFVYHEPFTLAQLGGLSIIWLGIVVYTVGGFRAADQPEHSLKEGKS